MFKAAFVSPKPPRDCRLSGLTTRLSHIGSSIAHASLISFAQLGFYLRIFSVEGFDGLRVGSLRVLGL